MRVLVFFALLIVLAVDGFRFRKLTSFRPTLRLTAAVDCAQGQFEATVVEPSSSTPVIVDFYADWCGPCKLVAPIFKQLAEEMPAVKFVKVDTDLHEDCAEKFNIQGLPLFGLFVKGKMVRELE